MKKNVYRDKNNLKFLPRRLYDFILVSVVGTFLWDNFRSLRGRNPAQMQFFF